MIKTKKDLREYLEADKRALGRRAKRPHFFDFVWKFQISLRYYEYFMNSYMSKKRLWHGGGGYFYWAVKYRIYSLLCGFEIPANCFGKGLSIAHKGPIIVNSHAKIGHNCRIHVCVNIGTSPGADNLSPTIGNNCYIGPGAKIWGKIYIGDNTVIGANAAVGKSFEEGNCCIAGVPAKIISRNGRKNAEK